MKKVVTNKYIFSYFWQSRLSVSNGRRRLKSFNTIRVLQVLVAPTQSRLALRQFETYFLQAITHTISSVKWRKKRLAIRLIVRLTVSMWLWGSVMDTVYSKQDMMLGRRIWQWYMDRVTSFQWSYKKIPDKQERINTFRINDNKHCCNSKAGELDTKRSFVGENGKFGVITPLNERRRLDLNPP